MFDSAVNAERILSAIEGLPSGRLFIAIDGRCASGKTTVSETLARTCGFNLIHMDDFYLPFAQRTQEQMARHGGNIDTGRLMREALHPLKAGRTVSYRPYNCHTGRFGKESTLYGERNTIVEGSYSLLPELFTLYDLRIFMDINSEEQLERLKKRNASSLEAFRSIWIPREESYFTQLHIMECCELVISGD